MTPTSATQERSEQATDTTAIRPFQVNVPEAELTELRRRINATRWPDRETVTDASQGVQLATTQAVARYWATEYDWRKCQARLNALPQFITEIDGLDIHFIHVRSKHDNALPLIVTHGWPGSVVEQLKIIDPLTNPTAHGASASDAFHLVIPSIPGYGYSGKPTTKGWDPAHIARAWVALMKRLGYRKFVAQGGDWGAVITELMGAQAPPELLGIHTNMPNVIPLDIDKAAFSGAPAPAGLSAEEKVAYERLSFVYGKGIGYGFQMGLRPQTLYGIADSPVGLAAYFLDHDARRQRHDHLVDEHGGFRRPPLLGELGGVVLRRQGRQRRHPGGRERLPRRALSGSAELGGAGVSQPDLLQEARQRRALRSLGAAAAPGRGRASGLQTAALSRAAATFMRPQF